MDGRGEELAQEHRAHGNALFGQDRWQEAADEYSKGIEHMPENHVLYCNRAACLAQKAVGRFHEALIDANHCVELSPTWVKGYARKAQVEYLLGQYADAEATCRRGLEIDAGSALLRAQLQMCRDAGHRTDLGEDMLMANKEAAAIEKSRGNSAFQERKWDEAVVLFTNALECDPTDHVFWSNRSATLLEKDNFEGARRDAEYCVYLKPDWCKGYIRLSTALWHLGRYSECRKAAEDGLKVDGGNEALHKMLDEAEKECLETPEVQETLRDMRAEKRKQTKMVAVLSNIPGIDQENLRINGVEGLNMATGSGEMVPVGGLTLHGMGRSLSIGAMHRMTDAQMRTIARSLFSPNGLADFEEKPAIEAAGTESESGAAAGRTASLQ